VHRGETSISGSEQAAFIGALRQVDLGRAAFNVPVSLTPLAADRTRVSLSAIVFRDER
jgi:hypothetical protein